MSLIPFEEWLNDFTTEYDSGDGVYRVPRKALQDAQASDESMRTFNRLAQGIGENAGQWEGSMRSAYGQLTSPDASGRLRFGTDIRGLAPNADAGASFDRMLVDVGGKPYLRVGSGYDEYVQAFKNMGQNPDALRADAFQYNPETGYLLDAYEAKKYGEMLRAPDNNSPFEAAAKTILPAMGFTGLMSFMGGGGLGGLFGAEGAASLPESYWSMLADAGGVASDALPAGIGLESGAAGAFDAAGVGTGIDAGTMASTAGLGAGVTGPVFPSVAGPTVGSSGGITGLISRIGSAGSNLLKGDASGDDLKTLGTAAAVGGGALALGGAVASGGLGGSTTQTSSTSFPGMSAEERELIALNAELTRRQLAAIDQLQPFQKAMLEAALDELNRAKADSAATSGAISPQEQADYARQEFERAKRLGPIQDEILGIQLDQLRRGGAATPEQEALIARATDSAVGSANADIDAATSRGIGLIADELSNARGLRLSDSPMSGEAALLAREGLIQKGGIERSLRANQANAQLNYPLAVQELSAKTSQIPLTIADAAKRFQEELRARAFNNRMSLIGTGVNTGIGLSSVGGGNGALSALTQSRLNSGTTTTSVNRGIGLSDVGNLASGIGGILSGAGRLFS